MDLARATEIATLVKRKEYLEKILDTTKSGYKDEWELRNVVTGASVEIDSDVLSSFTRKAHEEISEIKSKIENM